MPYGITPAGFVPKPLDACKAELEDDFRGAFGQGINLSPPSRFATLIGILAERFSELWDLAAAVYSSFDPEQAAGEALENVAILTGTYRAAARASIAKGVALAGAPGLTIPSGRVLSVAGAPESRFALAADVTLNAAGTGVGDFVAEKTGPTPALAGTLTVIETPVAGWNSATNPADAELGAHVETDPELRSRRRVELSSLGNAALEAIRGDVLQVKDVVACSVFGNDEAITNPDGMPPHSVEVVVTGGLDAEIAAAIFGSLSGGVKPHGTTAVTVYDSEGIAHSIRFTRPAVKTVYVVAAVAKDPKVFPADGEQLIRDALLEFGRKTYVGGVDVTASRLYGPIAGVAGVLDVSSLFIGTAPNPATSVRIPVSTREIGVLDSARISLNFTDEVP